jgi:hypothetical protein
VIVAIMRTALILLGWFTMAMPLCADLWTNQAGRVIEARLEAFDGASVTLTRTNGAHLKLPLSALCPTDQQRVLSQMGRSVVPAFIQAAYRDARTIIDQFERLPTGLQTEQGRASSVRMAREVFDARLKPRLNELKDKNVLEEVQRLRASLEGQ